MARSNYKKSKGKGSKTNYVDPKKYNKKRFDDKKDVNDPDERLNDSAWYFTSPELANQAAQLSFQNVLGFGDVYGYDIPSILRIDVAACPGVTEDCPEVLGAPFAPGSTYNTAHVATPRDGKAGVNLMAAKLYTTLSSFTGRTASYAPQDVAMMIQAIALVAEWSEMLRRCFGLALTYNYRNRTLPLGLLRSMGLDVDDFVANISIYRMRFNVAMSRINQIPLLENIAFIKKSRDIFQYVYMDDPTEMAQLFYYMPTFSGEINETRMSTGTIIETDVLDMDTDYTMDQWLSRLESMITQVLESSTLNFIYADMLNMANKVKVTTWKFDYLAENYVVMPIYNRNALLQLHNSNVMGMPHHAMAAKGSTERTTITEVTSGSSTIHITPGFDVFSDPDKNNVIYNPEFQIYTSRPIKATIVDMDSSAPTIEDRIEALRYTSAWSGAVRAKSTGDPSTWGGYTYCNALPDHYITRMHLFSNIDASKSLSDTVYQSTERMSYGAGSIKLPAKLTVFEHAPLMMFSNAASETSDGTKLGHIVGNLQYYTTVDYNYVRRLLDIMYVGLFDFRV